MGMDTHQAEYDQEAGHCGQDEHDLCLLHVVLAEQLHLMGLAHLHVLGPHIAREQEICKYIHIIL